MGVRPTCRRRAPRPQAFAVKFKDEVSLISGACIAVENGSGGPATGTLNLGPLAPV